MKTVIIPALGFLLFFAESIACAQGDKALPAIALVGGTLIDVSNSGHSTRDIPNAVVVLRAGKIEGAGPAALVKVPRDARTIDCRGAYILPGLVDGFAGLNSQPQANAWLYMGVTTIVGRQDDRCGRLKRDAHPSPHVYPIDLVGSIDVDSFLVSIPHWRNKLKSNDDVVELNEQESKAQLEDLWRQGVRAAYLGRDLTADRTKFIISECRRLGLVTYGEFASTPYADALDDGVDVLLHMTRYALGLIPHRLQQPLVQDLEGGAHDAAYTYLLQLDPADPSIAVFGKQIKASGAALMPTLSLSYLLLPHHRNLWKEPAASILDPKGLHKSPDPISGEASEEQRDAVQRQAQFWAINRTLQATHPIYLAGVGLAHSAPCQAFPRTPSWSCGCARA